MGRQTRWCWHGAHSITHGHHMHNPFPAHHSHRHAPTSGAPASTRAPNATNARLPPDYSLASVSHARVSAARCARQKTSKSRPQSLRFHCSMSRSLLLDVLPPRPVTLPPPPPHPPRHVQMRCDDLVLGSDANHSPRGFSVALHLLRAHARPHEPARAVPAGATLTALQVALAATQPPTPV